MTVHAPEKPSFAVLSTFTSAPELRQKFVALMSEFIETGIWLQPGLHSVEVFTDETGGQIVTLVKWQDRASFERFKQSEAGRNAATFGLALQPRVQFLRPEGAFAKEQ